MNFSATLRKTFGFDYRSMAFYRFLLGLIVCSDVIYRMLDLTNFYTDAGLVPRATFITEMSMPWSFSFHLGNGSFGFALIMFVFNLILGIMLTLGHKTRWAIAGAFIMNVSVHNRNWLINNGGDDILRAILFLSIFLPMNKYFSIDSALTDKKDPPAHKEYISTWTFAFYLQVFVIYFISYLLKDHAIWRSDYTAVFYSGRLDIFSTPFGHWMRNYPLLEKLSTIYTIYLEFLGPIFLILGAFIGRRWWPVRLAVVLLFVGLHAGIIATMYIGVFPWTCIVMWLLFIPGEVWDYILIRFKKKNFGQLTIHFDGECRFCRKSVLILREFFLLPEVRIQPTQDTPEIHQLMQKEHSWVVVNEGGQKFLHYHGMVEVLRHSPILKWTLPVLSKNFFVTLNQPLYKWVARHRMELGLYTQFLDIKSPGRPIAWLRWISEATGAFIFATLLMWNLTTIKKWDIRAPFFQDVTRWLHLYQEWNMFAPFPKLDNIWVEIPAELMDGTQLELLTGDSDIIKIKDKDFVKTVKNEHWRKFYLNLGDKTENARYYGGYLCREWNERNVRWVKSTTLRKFEIIVYSQPNLADGSKGGISRKLSWKHWCFDSDYKKESGAQ